MMSYHLVQPPFEITLRDMSTAALRSYGEWFIAIQQERVHELEAAVNESPQFQHWRADFSPKSLEMLGDWYTLHIKTRSRSAIEEEDISTRLGFTTSRASWELTNTTFSLAFDVGIYFGLVLKANNTKLRWEQLIKSKSEADYGQVVLQGFGTVPLNPVRIAVNVAYGSVEKKASNRRLFELYWIWEKMIRSDI